MRRRNCRTATPPAAGGGRPARPTGAGRAGDGSTAARAVGIEPREGIGRGDAGTRRRGDDREVETGHETANPLAPALHHRGRTPQEEGHVAAERTRALPERRLVERRPEQRLEASQGGRGVARTAAESGADRDALLYGGRHAFGDAGTPAEELDGPGDQVELARKAGHAVERNRAVRSCPLEPQRIRKVDGLEQRHQVVEPVGPPVEHREVQVHLGRRLETHPHGGDDRRGRSFWQPPNPPARRRG